MKIVDPERIVELMQNEVRKFENVYLGDWAYIF